MQVNHHGLAIFLDECPLLRQQQDLNALRRPAQAHAEFRDDDGAVDQDRMGLHGIEQGRIAQLGIGQPQLIVQSPCRASPRARTGRTLDQVDQFGARWRGA